MSGIQERLLSLLPPPSVRFADDGDWQEAENEIGTKLPADYKWFISTYGFGTICDYFWACSPFLTRNANGNLHQTISNMSLIYPGYYKEGFIDQPLVLFPNAGGLLVFGNTSDLNQFHWRTNGDPDKWDIAVWDNDEFNLQFLEGLSFTAALVQLLDGTSQLYSNKVIHPDNMLPNPKFLPMDLLK